MVSVILEEISRKKYSFMKHQMCFVRFGTFLDLLRCDYQFYRIEKVKKMIQIGKHNNNKDAAVAIFVTSQKFFDILFISLFDT